MVDHLNCARNWAVKRSKYENLAMQSITIAKQVKYSVLAEEARKKSDWHMGLHLKSKNKSKSK